VTPPTCVAQERDKAAPGASCSMGQLLGMTEWILPPPPGESPRSTVDVPLP
jgi:hypothetical protein